MNKLLKTLRDEVIKLGVRFDSHLDWHNEDKTEVRVATLENQVDVLENDSLIQYNTDKPGYDCKFGDAKLCACGHQYHRHFDSYENMDPVGCKYCGCETFIEQSKKPKGKCYTKCKHSEDIVECCLWCFEYRGQPNTNPPGPESSDELTTPFTSDGNKKSKVINPLNDEQREELKKMAQWHKDSEPDTPESMKEYIGHLCMFGDVKANDYLILKLKEIKKDEFGLIVYIDENGCYNSDCTPHPQTLELFDVKAKLRSSEYCVTQWVDVYEDMLKKREAAEAEVKSRGETISKYTVSSIELAMAKEDAEDEIEKWKKWFRAESPEEAKEVLEYYIKENRDKDIKLSDVHELALLLQDNVSDIAAVRRFSGNPQSRITIRDWMQDMIDIIEA